MKKTFFLSILLFVFAFSISAQSSVHLKVGDYWRNYYPNTKNIRADVVVDRNSDGTVQVLVLDAYNFGQYLKGQSYVSLYNYGWVRSVSVNLNLQKKTACYLVVSNIGGFVQKDFRISVYR